MIHEQINHILYSHRDFAYPKVYPDLLAWWVGLQQILFIEIYLKTIYIRDTEFE